MREVGARSITARCRAALGLSQHAHRGHVGPSWEKPRAAGAECRQLPRWHRRRRGGRMAGAGGEARQPRSGSPPPDQLLLSQPEKPAVKFAFTHLSSPGWIIPVPAPIAGLQGAAWRDVRIKGQEKDYHPKMFSNFCWERCNGGCKEPHCSPLWRCGVAAALG